MVAPLGTRHENATRHAPPCEAGRGGEKNAGPAARTRYELSPAPSARSLFTLRSYVRIPLVSSSTSLSCVYT